MEKYREYANPGGINGTGKGVVNTNSADYLGLQQAIRAHTKQQTPKEAITYGLLSLAFQMESYLSDKGIDQVKSAGEFLKEHLVVIGIRHKVFAEYIGVEASNLSAVLNGKRKITIDLAVKLGQIFQVHSSLWLLIQSKNDLLAFEEATKEPYQHLRLEDLMDKAS